MALKNIIITSSINSIPTQSYGQKTYIPSNDYQSFPIVGIKGEYGLPYELGGVTQSYSESINTPAGRISFVDNTRTEFIDGQFKGTAVLVSNGELSEDNPFVNVSVLKTFYTPVYYYDIPNAISNNNRNDIPLSNFLDPNTKPDVGEIYIGASVNTIGSLPLNLLDWQTYAIKIATIDGVGNNNTVALQALESFKIFFSDTTSITCDVTSIVDYSSQEYILYWVKPTFKTGLRAHEPDGKVLNYAASASFITASITSPSGESEPGPITGSFNISYNPLNYFDSSSGVFIFPNTPNTRLYITASFNSTDQTTISLRTYYGPGYDLENSEVLFSENGNAGNNTISDFFTPVANQPYILVFTSPPGGGNTTISNFQFLVTQSQNPDTGSSDLTILSPYFTQNFFYNDWNALYGNADGLEFDKNFMKVTYETGQSIPTNQEEIISGSAEKAPVKPYNYALKAQTLPRYEGVKSTSPNFNQNTTEGGYGTLPNAESLKIVVAYCDSIASWAPEKMNSSAVHIKYLIDENGDIITPNTTENSLFTNKFSFISEERALIKSDNQSSGNPNPYRTIFRGGTRIEPILYTQLGSQPLVQWASSIELEDITSTVGGAVVDVRANAWGGMGNSNYGTSISFGPMVLSTANQNFGNPSYMYWYPEANSRVYLVPSEVLIDNIALTFKLSFNEKFYFKVSSPPPQGLPTTVGQCKLYLRQDRKDILGNYYFYKDYPATIKNFDIIGNGNPNNLEYAISNTSFGNVAIVPPNDLEEGARLYFVIQIIPSNLPVKISEFNGIAGIIFSIEQNPAPTPPIQVGINNIWGFLDKLTYPNVITSSAAVFSSLASLYNSSNIKMKDITGSGFNSVVLPWFLKNGDEFRFEGTEDQTYVINKVYGPNDGINIPYSASLNLTNIAIEASTIGSSSFSINGISFYFTGSNEANISNTIYINTSSFASSTINNYIITSSNIFNYSSSVAPYSASLSYISVSGSSPNLIFSYGGPNNTLPTLISGSTTISFGGGIQERLSPSNCIEIHFTRNLPISSSTAVFNLDHFLIRRYIDDAAQIIIDGFAPLNSVGPYIVTPEYITSKLSSNIDKYITDLTQKGLL